jgi:hypothetical protein
MIILVDLASPNRPHIPEAYSYPRVKVCYMVLVWTLNVCEYTKPILDVLKPDIQSLWYLGRIIQYSYLSALFL